MHRVAIQRSSLRGSLVLPSSKSHTIRAICLGALAAQETSIEAPLLSADAMYLIQAMEMFGAKCTAKQDILSLRGPFIPPQEPLHIFLGGSGVGLRFLTALASQFTCPVTFTGDETLLRRPSDDLLSGLQQLGVKIDGGPCPPFTVCGPMRPGRAVVNGMDSQPVSALLIAASLLPGRTELIVENPGERPFVDMTLQWLERCGACVGREGYHRFIIEGFWKPKPFVKRIPGDLSSLAFPFAAALVSDSQLCIENVDLADIQGDKCLLEIAEAMGAHWKYDSHGQKLTITGPVQLKGIEVDCGDCVDAFPILAVLGAVASGVTRLRNIEAIRYKECDRVSTMQRELTKMGARVVVVADGIEIEGSALAGANLMTYGDHRVAMALTVAALAAEGVTTLDDKRCVTKTYPSFFEDMRRLGAFIEEVKGE